MKTGTDYDSCNTVKTKMTPTMLTKLQLFIYHIKKESNNTPPKLNMNNHILLIHVIINTDVMHKNRGVATKYQYLPTHPG